MGEILDLIKDGDLRTVGGSAAAAALVRAKPELAAELMDLMSYPNAAVRMRAADALEKASAGNEVVLAPFKALLLELANGASQKELRWHLAQLLPRLNLGKDEILDAAELFQRWFASDKSHIVQTFALQGLADFAAQNGQLIDVTLNLVGEAAASSVPALKARARHMKITLERLKGKQGE
jgi:hypothetical protein